MSRLEEFCGLFSVLSLAWILAASVFFNLERGNREKEADCAASLHRQQFRSFCNERLMAHDPMYSYNSVSTMTARALWSGLSLSSVPAHGILVERIR